MGALLGEIDRIWYLYNIGEISYEDYIHKKEDILRKYNIEFIGGDIYGK